MKRTITTLLLCLGLTTARAQWSNTTNQFYDSLDMPVVQATNDQKNPLVVKSEPDGGYFVIWEDNRNVPAPFVLTDIYAQKYDKDGKALWAKNGVPVATGGTNMSERQYSLITTGVANYSSYSSVSHAAGDGNGGFYITWQAYASGSGVYVQHIKNDGSRVFANEGYPLAVPVSGQGISFRQPQLVTDGNGGFFIGYYDVNSSGANNLMVYGYKDEGGTLKRYGGDVMNQYYQLVDNTSPCGDSYKTPAGNPLYILVNSFFIFPDGQGGCGVAMALRANTGDQSYFAAFNWLARAKKDCHVIKTIWEDRGGNPTRYEHFYKKDSVVRAYTLSVGTMSSSCKLVSNPPKPDDPIYVWTSYFRNNYGFIALGPPVYGVEKINAALLHTDGNTDAALITWNERDYTNSTVTDFATRGYVQAMEIYDSLPYQLCTDTTNPLTSYNPIFPADKNKLNRGTIDVDTLIAPLHSDNQGYAYDYSIAGSGGRALLAASAYGNSGSTTASPFYYQEAKVVRQTADSFAVKINTASPTGVPIGIGTGNDLFLNLAGDGAGNATFYYLGPHGRDFVKASPIDEGGKLRWGALGWPLNSGGWSSAYYYPSSCFLYMDADGKAVVVWSDTRSTPDGYTAANIYMRHLDSLLKPNYQPPLLGAQLTINLASPYYSSSTFHSALSDQQSLAGSSNGWTGFSTEMTGATGGTPLTTVAQIKDDYDLGTVTVGTYEVYKGNSGRKTTDSKPYLDRNYTISVTKHPAGASIGVRLIFTKGEFDSLKALDPSINDPGDLSVVKQPSAGTNAPATYTPTASDEGVPVLAWAAIDTSGYYIEIAISDFSNFFIFPGESTLPVAFGSFTATAVGKTALLQWETATQTGNDHFDVQRSADGKVFATIGKVAGHGTTTTPQDYRFTDPAPLDGTNYYRLSQVDLDGRATLSPVQQLRFGGKGGLRVSPNPVRGLLHVVLPAAAAAGATIEVYDLTGRKVLQQRVAAGSLTQEADFTTLSAGTYILHYGQESVKVVKQ